MATRSQRPARLSHAERKAREELSRLREKLTKATKFRRGSCWITRNWQEQQLATVTFTRMRDDTHVSAVLILVDLGCLGIKDVAFHHNASLTAIRELALSAPGGADTIGFDDAARVVETAAGWGLECGFMPPADFEAARLIYADADPSASSLEITCGVEGKPFYVAGPKDDVETIMAALEERFGPDGFEYLIGLSDSHEPM